MPDEMIKPTMKDDNEGFVVVSLMGAVLHRFAYEPGVNFQRRDANARAEGYIECWEYRDTIGRKV